MSDMLRLSEEDTESRACFFEIKLSSPKIIVQQVKGLGELSLLRLQSFLKDSTWSNIFFWVLVLLRHSYIHLGSTNLGNMSELVNNLNCPPFSADPEYVAAY